jgi:hypothetical protein
VVRVVSSNREEAQVDLDILTESTCLIVWQHLKSAPQVVAGAVLQKPRRIHCCNVPFSRLDPSRVNVTYLELKNITQEQESCGVSDELCRACRRFADEIVELDVVKQEGEEARGSEEEKVEKTDQSCETANDDEKGRIGSENKFKLFCKPW